MSTLSYEVNISSSPDIVYKISQDYSVRYEWDPFPDKIELLDGVDRIRKGTKALVKAKNGLEMKVVFVQVDPPITAAIKMVKGPFFLKMFAGSWIFKAVDPDNTHARFVYSIKVKSWALPFITERLANIYFSRVIKKRLLGLKYYCESCA